jgi:hypothetical protein
MTTLTYRMAATLSGTWRVGDEVIVSRLDHDANVRPWVQAAARAGAVVRWAEVDAPTGELPLGPSSDPLPERTRLGAHNPARHLIGTMPDVPAITAMARAAGALSYVDGVRTCRPCTGRLTSGPSAPTTTRPVPTSGRAARRRRDREPVLLEPLRPDKLAPSSDAVPERFEARHAPVRLPGRGGGGGRSPGRA